MPFVILHSMTQQDIQDRYRRIIGELDRKELKSAFESLQSLMAANKDYFFQDKLSELQDTYKYMLLYYSEGKKDPMQQQIYNNLLASTYEIIDKIRLRLLKKESPLNFFSCQRNLSVSPIQNFSELNKRLLLATETENRKEFDDLCSLLFNKIWASDLLTSDDNDEIRNILLDKELPSSCASQIISSLWLGLQFMFDKKKLMLLFDAASIDDEEVQIRALISILLTLYIYKKRTALYPQIVDRLSALAENPGFAIKIRTIILRFILARETEKITQRLQDEIIPEMIKLSPKLGNKINLSDLSSEQINDEMNPEWEKFKFDSKLGKKMEEFSEMQQEGADIMHSTFIHLKNFPFFRTLSNWFLPFSSDYHLFGDRFKRQGFEKQMLDSMAMAAFMCNSDKYSFYFSMLQLPEQAQQMMINQFDSQAAELIQQNKEEILNKRGRTETIASQYIQDLYRFYKLYPSRTEFDDIFTMTLDFHQIEILKPYISDSESLKIIGEYYLHKNYFKEALGIFKKFAENGQNDEVIWQKIGYCYQMDGNLKDALDSYLRADLLNPESKWVTRRIAACYRSLKQPEEALKYYKRYESLNPDNLSVATSIGHCYLELKNYDEALKYFFKVDYLDNSSHKAWRPIAWCSFLTGKYDQARNYYKKILTEQPSAQDFLNAAHTEWTLQNTHGAIENYAKAVSLEDGDFERFKDLFKQDIPDLIIAGIEEYEIPLMMDQIRYRSASE